MATMVIQYDEHQGQIRRGDTCLAFRHGWTLLNGERFDYWFRGSNQMTQPEALAVSLAILTSEPTISGNELAEKITVNLSHSTTRLLPQLQRNR